MQNRLKMIALLVLLSAIGFAQQTTTIPKLPEKGTLQQNRSTDKTTVKGVQSNSSSAKTFDVAEGKKGLNAVNVKQSASANENGRTVKPNGQDDGNPFPSKNAKATNSGVDSASNALQTKHAINTKGTGATRNK